MSHADLKKVPSSFLAGGVETHYHPQSLQLTNEGKNKTTYLKNK